MWCAVISAVPSSSPVNLSDAFVNIRRGSHYPEREIRTLGHSIDGHVSLRVFQTKTGILKSELSYIVRRYPEWFLGVKKCFPGLRTHFSKYFEKFCYFYDLN